MHICAFLWSYYGYPTSTYEGVNVEAMRYRNGAIMAASDTEAGNNQDIDYIGGVPDSGTPHAIGLRQRERHPLRPSLYQIHPHLGPEASCPPARPSGTRWLR